MAIFAWIILFLAILTVLSYQRASLAVWTIALGAFLFILTYFDLAHYAWLMLFWGLYLVIFIPLHILPVRRMLTAKILHQYRKAMPSMSRTEREALTAGGIGWEGQLFSGMPNWNQLRSIPHNKLSQEEQAFLNGPVEKLCAMLDNWTISRTMQIPQPIWDFLKEHGFFGMIIPKQFGGLEFSALAHSEVIVKTAGVSVAVATVISVPNSLGPAELLLQYGTEEQKQYYLPRLARGEEIPCFALTSPVAGSDAGSITDYGIVCHAKVEGEKQVCIRLNWDKRYITLAPIATLLGLAFKLYDPEHILGEEETLGITCALIPTTLPGITIGRRHYPLDAAFPNGPTQGNDVLIPISRVIGGAAQVGNGWRMLMECLAAGRSISLPSMAIGGTKRALLASGAYARIRRQFNTAIAHFGGIEEALARIASHAYMAESLRHFTVSALDQGEVPAVASAISKYHTTELSRKVNNDAMDIHGGKGICMGPNNYLAQGYIEGPISITVEGANILTRSMIIFGQGAIRCHPYVLSELMAAQDQNLKRGLAQFDKALFSHLGFIISNATRAFWLGISNGCLARTPKSPLKRYYQHLSRFSAAFALLADTTMLTLGAALKRREKMSGRLADLLSGLYMSSAMLKYYQFSHNKLAELPVVKFSCQTLLHTMQNQIDALLANYPNKIIASLLRIVVLPLGKCIKPPKDKLTEKVAALLREPSPLRDRFAENIYLAPNENNLIGRMQSILEQVIAAEPIEKKLTTAERKGSIKGKTIEELITAGVKASIISKTEAQQMLAAHAARMQVINVDDFAPENITS